jgi:hypothetical protein
LFTCKSFAIRLTAGVAKIFDVEVLLDTPVSNGSSITTGVAKNRRKKIHSFCLKIK